MTDYKEEQRNEIEALESIYPDEMKIITDEPYYVITIDIKTEDPEDPSAFMAATMKFTYVPNYPDEPPIVEIFSSENLEETDSDELLDFLQAQVEEQLGMVMIFTLVSEASEWLNKRSLTIKTRKKEEEEMKLRQQEEEERKRFDGTRVTVETFWNWKNKFDQEIAELKKLQGKEDVASKKLTGRELFEKDRSLIDSDLQFLQEGEEEVKVDESLFQELDDLELQEELDDEEDDS